MTYAYREEAFTTVSSTPRALFGYLGDQANLGSHMEKPSMMMMGGSMRNVFDQDRGRATGSVIRMDGNVLGIGLTVEEVVTAREPPVRKVWETRGIPHLFILGGYLWATKSLRTKGMPGSACSSTTILLNQDWAVQWPSFLLEHTRAAASAGWQRTQQPIFDEGGLRRLTRHGSPSTLVGDRPDRRSDGQHRADHRFNVGCLDVAFGDQRGASDSEDLADQGEDCRFQHGVLQFRTQRWW